MAHTLTCTCKLQLVSPVLGQLFSNILIFMPTVNLYLGLQQSFVYFYTCHIRNYNKFSHSLKLSRNTLLYISIPNSSIKMIVSSQTVKSVILLACEPLTSLFSDLRHLGSHLCCFTTAFSESFQIQCAIRGYSERWSTHQH